MGGYLDFPSGSLTSLLYFIADECSGCIIEDAGIRDRQLIKKIGVNYKDIVRFEKDCGCRVDSGSLLVYLGDPVSSLIRHYYVCGKRLPRQEVLYPFRTE